MHVVRPYRIFIITDASLWAWEEHANSTDLAAVLVEKIALLAARTQHARGAGRAVERGGQVVRAVRQRARIGAARGAAVDCGPGLTRPDLDQSDPTRKKRGREKVRGLLTSSQAPPYQWDGIDTPACFGKATSQGLAVYHPNTEVGRADTYLHETLL